MKFWQLIPYTVNVNVIMLLGFITPLNFTLSDPRMLVVFLDVLHSWSPAGDSEPTHHHELLQVIIKINLSLQSMI